jgi:hypothetical protein
MHRLFGKKKEVGPAPSLGTLYPLINQYLSISSDVLFHDIDKLLFQTILIVGNNLLTYS